ncbi:30S ribosomal protein S4e [Candidatus Woesearchaeota archaeon]|nr:30S ribosomal protein S4e [Candidatus Woesearchaeota archaeon]
MAHLNRLAIPKSWPISKKKTKWITRPNPGPHPLREALPLNILVRDILKYAKTNKEVKTILNASKILINKVARNDIHFPIGLMDVVEIPETKEQFRIIYNKKGQFKLLKIDEKETNLKPLKIAGKKIIKGKKLQLNLSDGRNIIVAKDDYKVKDVVIFNLKENKIVEKLRLEKGAAVYIVDGKYKGAHGKVKEVILTGNEQPDKITFEHNGTEHVTLAKYAYVIGKEKPIIKIEE